MQDFRMETFISVCRHRNYTKAAQELHITQPAVTQQIHILETYYGVKLFQYQGKQILLTKEGELLYQAALRERHDEKQLKERMAGLKEGRRNLNFGVTLTIGEFVIPEKIAGILKADPRIAVRMSVANTKELLERLDGGEIDFAIVEGYFKKEAYDSLIFDIQPYICVCGREYEISRRTVEFEEILKETVIVREEGSGTREILERFLQEKNYDMDDFAGKIELNNMQAIKTLAEENCGVAFLYETAVRRELKEGRLYRVGIRGFEISHEFTFIWQKGSIFSEEFYKIYDILRSRKG